MLEDQRAPLFAMKRNYPLSVDIKIGFESYSFNHFCIFFFYCNITPESDEEHPLPSAAAAREREEKKNEIKLVR